VLSHKYGLECRGKVNGSARDSAWWKDIRRGCGRGVLRFICK